MGQFFYKRPDPPKTNFAKKFVFQNFPNYTKYLRESRLAVSGDGDRSCIFRPNLVPCRLLQFNSGINTNQFLRQISDIIDLVYEKCGKESIRSKQARVKI